ncbi:hypothetical protein PTKIN_Ptkin01aG0277400 [Pterospermum kingtungense]
MELLHAFFSLRDVNAILKIPLPRNASNDLVIWHYSKNGDYTIRSAYRLLMEHLLSDSHLHVPRDWSKLWGLQLPPKVKNFVWRAAREVLPNRDTLRNCGVDMPLACVFCNGAFENSWHLFLACNFAQQCWRVSRLDSTSPERVVKQGLEFFYESLQVCNKNTPNGEFGIGMINRDVNGNIVAYRFLEQIDLLSVKECEAIALYEALLWTVSLGYNRVFLSLIVDFVRRCVNGTAHALARQLHYDLTPTKDKLVWLFDKRGIYSVKSGYSMSSSLFPNDELKVSGDWNIIWKLEFPLRVKDFVWRAGRDCLPTRQRLQSRGCLQSP